MAALNGGSQCKAQAAITTVPITTAGFLPHCRHVARHGYKFGWFSHHYAPVAPARCEYRRLLRVSAWRMNGARWYTRKGMLHESRLQQVDETTVSFSYRDYQDENKRKIMTLGGDEFIRRYLSHVLPKGLMRIRHFGILGNRCRKQKLMLIRSQEKGKRRRQQKSETSAGHAQIQWHCPHCKVGLLQLAGHPALKRPDS